MTKTAQQIAAEVLFKIAQCEDTEEVKKKRRAANRAGSVGDGSLRGRPEDGSGILRRNQRTSRTERPRRRR